MSGNSPSIAQLCGIYGYSRQAYYKRDLVSKQRWLLEQILLELVREKRSRQPRIGVRKLHKLLAPELEKMGSRYGRDRLFALLREHRLLIHRKKKGAHTTDSHHMFRKYPNLIKGKEIVSVDQVYVCDITYIRTLEGFCYLSLVTDVFSRKIVGYSVSGSLSIEGSMEALKMALSSLNKRDGLIHHSDRGIQYCSKAYNKILVDNKIAISMTEENHVYENALAERVNGILKEEFLLGETLKSIKIAEQMVKQAIEIYNEERPHMALNYQTPAAKYAA